MRYALKQLMNSILQLFNHCVIELVKLWATYPNSLYPPRVEVNPDET